MRPSLASWRSGALSLGERDLLGSARRGRVACRQRAQVNARASLQWRTQDSKAWCHAQTCASHVFIWLVCVTLGISHMFVQALSSAVPSWHVHGLWTCGFCALCLVAQTGAGRRQRTGCGGSRRQAGHGVHGSTVPRHCTSGKSASRVSARARRLCAQWKLFVGQ